MTVKLFTAKEASAETALALIELQNSHRTTIDTIPLLYESIDAIHKLIEAATLNGENSTSFYVEKVIPKNAVKGSSDLNTVAMILHAFGYSVEFSCSSNPVNERVFITWPKYDD